MGAQGSTLPALQWGGTTIKAVDRVDFMSHLQQACLDDKVADYKELWASSWPFREQRIKANDQDFDNDLLSDNVMRYIRHGLQHPTSPDWREAGVLAARTFLYSSRAREQLKRFDLPVCLSMMTMGEEGDDPAAASGPAKRKQVERSLLSIEIMAELTAFPEFVPSICKASILNYLCIVLNQVPEAAEKVSQVFVQLSDQPANLNQLREASVSDIMESTFKTIPFERQEGDSARWKSNIKAISNVSRVLGTMLKYGHECQVDLDIVVKMLDRLGVPDDDKDAPDCLRLLSELARVFYWVCRTTGSAAQPFGQELAAEEMDSILQTLSRLWEKCCGIYQCLSTGASGAEADRFRTDDLDRSVYIDGPALKAKEGDARTLLCYMNCLFWLCAAQPTLRWKLRNANIRSLQLAFELREPELITVVLDTVRHLVDWPGAQQCLELMRLFGMQLVKYLVEASKGKRGTFPPAQVLLLLDTLAMMSLQRSMQELFTEVDIYAALQDFREAVAQRLSGEPQGKQEMQRVDVRCLLICAQVSVHPGNRLQWVRSNVKPVDAASKKVKAWSEETQYPPRHEFQQALEHWSQDDHETMRTVASLLLTVFQERKFHQPAEDLVDTFRSVLEWWKANSSAQYEEKKEAFDTNRDFEDVRVRTLREHLEHAMQRRESGVVLTSKDAMSHCAPQECVLALSLFSRLALEPKFKGLFRDQALDALLSCVCSGVCAEAREAAATLANLMWMPDFREEKLVCWLKFDGPSCIAVDAANVLTPVKTGHPKPVEMGRGMYKSTWGMNFVQGSCITLHPEGLQTHKVPGTLTTASPSDTFSSSARQPYKWLGTEPDRRRFAVTCWFYWPVNPTKDTKVLVQTTPSAGEPSLPSVAVECAVQCRCGNTVSAHDVLYADARGCDKCRAPWAEIEHGEAEFFWVLCDEQGAANRHAVRTPKLMPGWHHLAIVCSQSSGQNKSFEGTKLWLDTWCQPLRNFWIKNDFYNIGNWTGSRPGEEGGKMPFGLIADFRIYADSSMMTEKAVKDLATQKNFEKHPDEIARALAARDAAAILATRLDCPDTAAECLRALGSLATLATQRARIFSVCGREALQMLDSPHPMLRRQAARLLGNLA